MRDTPDIAAVKRQILKHLSDVYTDNKKTKALRMEPTLSFVYDAKTRAETFVKANVHQFRGDTGQTFVDTIVAVALALLADEGQPRELKK